ncbi:MAG: glucosaminidase domain-containing protein [Epsilonproteobacteria bacterium]|nr:glucosaminidase domain-containing protein [Campylobacterota bacterium]
MVTLNGIIKGLVALLLIEITFFSTFFILQVEEKNQVLVVKKKLEVPIIEPVPIPQEVKEVEKVENPFKVIAPKSHNDIVCLTNHKVQPILYKNTIPLAPLSIEKKKETFINMLLPSILLAKYKIKLERKKLLRLSNETLLSDSEILWLENKRKEFEVQTNDELYDKMELHPTSLIIAQAIVESGWGTSKFFQKANNVFGVWSFNENESRIVASEKRGNQYVYLKKYKSLDQSIRDYFLTISNVTHYQAFREKRLETQDPFTLVEHLEKYSELGKEYIANLKNIMRKNKLLVYDNYQLDL